MSFPLAVAEAWMSCSGFADKKAENNAPYPTLVERWTKKSVAYENQALLVMEMVEADEKNAVLKAAA